MQVETDVIFADRMVYYACKLMDDYGLSRTEIAKIKTERSGDLTAQFHKGYITPARATRKTGGTD